jgi:hypothetical protein
MVQAQRTIRVPGFASLANWQPQTQEIDATPEWRCWSWGGWLLRRCSGFSCGLVSRWRWRLGWSGCRIGPGIAGWPRRVARRAAGVSRTTGNLWLAEAGGVRPRVVNPELEAAVSPGTGVCHFTDRCWIRELVKAGYKPQIAELLGHHPCGLTVMRSGSHLLADRVIRSGRRRPASEIG